MFFLLLWFGSNPVLSNLVVSMESTFDSMPLSTLVLEDPSETTQNSLAQKLTTRTKKRVFVSYNLPMTDSNLSLLVENRIKKEMEVHMDTFESFPHLYRLFTKIIQWREQHYLPV